MKTSDASMYLGLKQGQMNANLIRMVHKDLKIELRSLALKCIRENKETQSRVQKLNINGKDHYVKITIRPLLYAVKPDEFYMVAFEEVKVADTSQKIITPLEKKKKAGSGNYGRNSIQPEPTFRN